MAKHISGAAANETAAGMDAAKDISQIDEIAKETVIRIREMLNTAAALTRAAVDLK